MLSRSGVHISGIIKPQQINSIQRVFHVRVRERNFISPFHTS